MILLQNMFPLPGRLSTSAAMRTNLGRTNIWSLINAIPFASHSVAFQCPLFDHHRIALVAITFLATIDVSYQCQHLVPYRWRRIASICFFGSLDWQSEGAYFMDNIGHFVHGLGMESVHMLAAFGSSHKRTRNCCTRKWFAKP
jgi:hypothetical protein